MPDLKRLRVYSLYQHSLSCPGFCTSQCLGAHPLHSVFGSYLPCLINKFRTTVEIRTKDRVERLGEGRNEREVKTETPLAQTFPVSSGEFSESQVA